MGWNKASHDIKGQEQIEGKLGEGTIHILHCIKRYISAPFISNTGQCFILRILILEKM